MASSPHSLFHTLVCVLVFVFLNGCGAPPKKPPTLIQATVAAAADVNPDGAGRASPVVVRLLELKALGAFESADFFALSEKSRETLGVELVASEEFVLQPGERKKFDRPLQDDTRFVAAVAAFRDLDRSTWRAAVPVRLHQSTPVTISLRQRTIAIDGK